MTYFNGIRLNDKVWDFMLGYGVVIELTKDSFIVDFINNSHIETYCYDGKRCYCDECNQTLFWDKVNFKLPKKRPKIELNNVVMGYDKGYQTLSIQFGENNKKSSVDTIIQFTKLLTLRDQECQKSRNYTFVKGGDNYTIKYDFAEEEGSRWVTSYTDYYYFPDRVYFKTEDDAQKICDILNDGRFEL